MFPDPSCNFGYPNLVMTNRNGGQVFVNEHQIVINQKFQDSYN